MSRWVLRGPNGEEVPLLTGRHHYTFDLDEINVDPMAFARQRIAGRESLDNYSDADDIPLGVDLDHIESGWTIRKL